MNVPFALRIVYSTDMMLLLICVLLVWSVRRPISDAIGDMTGIRIPWMLVLCALILLLLLVGLFQVGRDARELVAGKIPAMGIGSAAGLILSLVLMNAIVIPIIVRVSIMGYVPVVTRISKMVLRAEADYTLPEMLRLSDGTEVADQTKWTKARRPELLALFENEVYGKIPDRPISMAVSSAVDNEALDGKAIRKEVVLSFENNRNRLDTTALLYIPKDAGAPVPAFAGLNFIGNHTVHPDPGITRSRKRTSDGRPSVDAGNPSRDDRRGSRASRWPVERILERGYALVTMHYEDIDPDFDDGFRNGIHPLFYAAGQDRPEPNEWGSIAAWSWGLSRIMDYLETDEDIDHARVIAVGHSRLGKTALWAGARDERFAAVISNDSGCMGAALSRRKYGETLADLTAYFPHWLCGNFAKYAGREDELPVDQHMLISLIAPRPVYIASADLDLWADPEGEFLAARAASEAYHLFGKDGLVADRQPKLHDPVMGDIGYHIRKGTHDVTGYDWECFLDFADLHFGSK